MLFSTARLRLSLFALICFLLCVGLLPVEAYNPVSKLTAAYTSPDGNTTFRYPTEWNIETIPIESPWMLFQARMGNTQNLNANLPVSGEVKLETYVGYGWEVYLTNSNEPVTDAPQLMSIIQEQVENNLQQNLTSNHLLQFSPISEAWLGSQSAAYFTVSTASYDVLYVAVRYVDGLVNLISLTMSPGEIPKWQEVILAMAGSFRFNFNSIISPAEWHQSPPVADTVIGYNSADFPELSNDYSIDHRGTFSFNYPTDLLIDNFEERNQIQVLMVTDERLFENSAVPDVGEAKIWIILRDLRYTEPRMDSDATPVEALRAYVKLFQMRFLTYYGYTLIQPITIDDHPAALLASNPLPGVGRFQDGLMVAVELENRWFGFIVVEAAYGELDLWQDTALAIAVSLTYNPD